MALPDHEPTTGEVLRRLDEVSQQMRDIAQQLREDRLASAATYVRQDVYMAQRQADSAVVADLAGDVMAINRARESDAGWRRQVLLTLAVLAISTLVSIALAIVNLR